MDMRAVEPTQFQGRVQSVTVIAAVRALSDTAR
jgi:hypothetical protein